MQSIESTLDLDLSTHHGRFIRKEAAYCWGCGLCLGDDHGFKTRFYIDYVNNDGDGGCGDGRGGGVGVPWMNNRDGRCSPGDGRGDADGRQIPFCELCKPNRRVSE